MKIKELHVRFYKAFNFDYLRKYHRSSSPLPWEIMEDGSWYPFVTVDLESDITTIVGANESGKSQVLDATEIALSGTGARRTDFCRYSRFFLVDRAVRLPDFGATFSDLSVTEAEQIAGACGVDGLGAATFTLIRGGDGTTSIYVKGVDEWTSHALNAKAVEKVNRILPRSFRLNPQIPLPDAVPLTFLSREGKGQHVLESLTTRGARQALLQRLASLPSAVVASAKAVTDNAAVVADAFGSQESETDPNAEAKFELADKLLIDIAGIGREHFSDLVRTLRDGEDGYVDGVEELINRALATKLNFRRWWTQDSNFQLRVTIRESDVAFIVSDRTGTHYSFTERSGGLSYFLSYFVQYLSHEPTEDRCEVLLMDEPDAYLSSQGQKDLLKIFEGFANREDGKSACQVVYVTHSPFLVDKNHAERLRVIEKGEGDEGTRVVRDVARNHYEPLRSAFGALVAETTFMGNCNLMVEGIGDQVLLAGLSRRLRTSGIPKTEFLDLNDLTIVPAGGASHVPYLVYLARGRDVEKPAVIVLLDGDEAGTTARSVIKRGGAYRKRLVDDGLVLQLSDSELAIASDRPGGPVEIEDLVPIDIAVRAAASYARDFGGYEVAAASWNTSKVSLADGVLKAAELLLNEDLAEPIGLEKVGFARSVLDILTSFDRGELALHPDSVERLELNFRSVFGALGARQRIAMRAQTDLKVSDRLARVRDGFLADHVSEARRVDVVLLFEELGYALDDSPEAEDIRSEMRRLTREHQLEIDTGAPIEDMPQLRSDLQALQYLARQRSQEPSDDLAGSESVEEPDGAAPETT